MPQTSPSKRPAAQVAFAKKAADAKAAKGKTNLIAPDLIDGNEREFAEEALGAANRPAREHDERSLHAACAPRRQDELGSASVSEPAHAPVATPQEGHPSSEAAGDGKGTRLTEEDAGGITSDQTIAEEEGEWTL